MRKENEFREKQALKNKENLKGDLQTKALSNEKSISISDLERQAFPDNKSAV